MIKPFFLWILLLSLEGVYPVFENCDFFQNLETDKTYTIYSPGYPNWYTPGLTCRWVAQSLPHTNIYLSCPHFSTPETQNCMHHKFGVSRGGRIDLKDVQYYCGQGTIEVKSHSNSLNLVLLTNHHFRQGGLLFCNLVAKAIHPQPPATCVCGYKNTMRIVGGSETAVNEYPMMAALVDGPKKSLFCGATVISPKFVLTAAHCLLRRKVQEVGVLVGDHDISSGSETDSAKLLLVQSFIPHPEYDTVNQRNDLALVQVKEPIPFGMKVGPACLPFKNARVDLSGQTVFAVGWGSINFGGPSSDKLLHAPLTLVSQEKCKPIYGPLLTEKQICTYQEDKDACQSDSGGPILWLDPNNGAVNVLGVISFGIQCGTTAPSVNTRVSSYLDWITTTTGEQFCIM